MVEGFRVSSSLLSFIYAATNIQLAMQLYKNVYDNNNDTYIHGTYISILSCRLV